MSERMLFDKGNKQVRLSGRPLFPLFGGLSQKSRPNKVDEAVDQRRPLERVELFELLARFLQEAFGRSGVLFVGEAGQGPDDPFDEGLDPEGPSLAVESREGLVDPVGFDPCELVGQVVAHFGGKRMDLSIPIHSEPLPSVLYTTN